MSNNLVVDIFSIGFLVFATLFIVLIIAYRCWWCNNQRITPRPQIQPIYVANIPLPNTLDSQSQQIYSNQQNQSVYSTVPTMPKQNLRKCTIMQSQGEYPILTSQRAYPSDAPPEYSCKSR